MELDRYTTRYRPPRESCAEFEVEFTLLRPYTVEHSIMVIPCGSIMMILRDEGGGLQLSTSSDDDNSNSSFNRISGDSSHDQGEALIARMQVTSNRDNEVSITTKNAGIYYIPALAVVTISTYDQPVSIYRAHVNLGV